MKWLRWIAVLLVLLPVWAAAQEEFVTEFPPALRFTQQAQIQEASKDISIKCVYPDTANDTVDEDMRALIDRLAAQGEAQLPPDRVTVPSWLDVGAVVSRSGESVLSFLAIAEISREKQQLSVAYETRVYDMEDGKRLSLSDFIREDAYAYIAGEIRSQLTAAFPGVEPDAEALEALLSEESIRSAPFTLGAARMTLTYRADLLYPGKASLLHVHLYYAQLRDRMTDYGLRQTDNSRYRMVALTYDDGGARSTTRKVLDHLRSYGAQATFFVVGEQCPNNRDILLRQQDSKHSIQSHSYSHRYRDEIRRSDAQKEKQKMIELLGGLTGVVPTMMRAPGGQYDHYIRWEIGYPLIQWSLASGDSGNKHYDQIADRVIRNARDGAVILLHDINPGSPVYTEEILHSLAERGILCVTVEELFSDAGVALQENVAYKNPYILAE